MIIRGEITKQKMENIYTTIRNTIQNKECYYTAKEVEELKKDRKNTFIKGGGTNERRRM